ncbi:hypothetical protein [Crossiella sp. CA198]|uniref:hypothetical protein n=1 Tax=Crossiella sp. CA198 TaxID=3455607 RepID=UPI003F8D1751
MTDGQERDLLVGAIVMSLEDIVEAGNRVLAETRKKRRDAVGAALTVREEHELASASANLARLLAQHLELRKPKPPIVVDGEIVPDDRQLPSGR